MDLTTALKVKFPFGKYKNHQLWEVRDRDPEYLHWLSGRAWVAGQVRDALDAVLDHMANRREAYDPRADEEGEYFEGRGSAMRLGDSIDEAIRRQYDPRHTPPLFGE